MTYTNVTPQRLTSRSPLQYERLDGDIFSDPVLSKSESLQMSMKKFIDKNGVLDVFSQQNIELENSRKIEILDGDAIFPVCSGAACRSQVLHRVLERRQENTDIESSLMPPHAARYGCDPYDGRFHIDMTRLSPQDDFEEFQIVFERPRINPFGKTEFERLNKKLSNQDKIAYMRDFYDNHYFRFKCVEGKTTVNRRVFIVFRQNVHVILKRLSDTNADLKDVVVYALPLKNEMIYPPKDLNTTSRSIEAYQAFQSKIERLFDF